MQCRLSGQDSSVIYLGERIVQYLGETLQYLGERVVLYLGETGKAKFLSAAIWLLLPLSHSLSRDEDDNDDYNEETKKKKKKERNKKTNNLVAPSSLTLSFSWR